jgi:hypothetical protein
MKVTKIDIPIYFGRLKIVIAKDFNEAAKRIGYECNSDLSVYDAFVFPGFTKNGFSIYTAVFKPDASYKSVAHEAVHLVNNVFKDRGIKLDVFNDEPQAYLTGWFTGEIHKALKK